MKSGLDSDESLVVVPVSELNKIVEKSVQEALQESLPSIIRRANLPEYISTSELSKLAGFSPGKIQYMRSEGRIKYIQEGRSIIYPTKWILKYLERHQITPREDVLEELRSNNRFE